MKKFFITFLYVFLTIALLSITLAASNVVTLSVDSKEKTNDKYTKGEKLIVNISIDESPNNFGYLMGSIVFDDSYLEFLSSTKSRYFTS